MSTVLNTVYILHKLLTFYLIEKKVFPHLHSGNSTDFLSTENIAI